MHASGGVRGPAKGGEEEGDVWKELERRRVKTEALAAASQKRKRGRE